MARAEERYKVYLVDDEENTDEIATTFAHELMNQCGPHNTDTGFRVFWPRRDAMPGESRINSHYDTAEKSDCILCTVTPSSYWLKYCQETGLYHKICTDESENVIIVLVGFANNTDAKAACPRELNYKAKVIFGLDWRNDDISWKRLKTALGVPQSLPATFPEQDTPVNHPIQCTEYSHDRSVERNNLVDDDLAVDGSVSETIFADEETIPKEEYSSTDQQRSCDTRISKSEKSMRTRLTREMGDESTGTLETQTTLDSSADCMDSSLDSYSTDDLASCVGAKRLDRLVTTDYGQPNVNSVGIQNTNTGMPLPLKSNTTESRPNSDQQSDIDSCVGAQQLDSLVTTDSGEPNVNFGLQNTGILLPLKSNSTESGPTNHQQKPHSLATDEETIDVDCEHGRGGWNFAQKSRALWNWIQHY